MEIKKNKSRIFSMSGRRLFICEFGFSYLAFGDMTRQ